MLGKLLLIVILATQLLVLLVLYVTNPNGFNKAISSIDDVAKGEDPAKAEDGDKEDGGDEGDKQEGGDEGSTLLERRHKIYNKL